MAGQFTKKTVDIEALMAQAAALEEESKQPAKKAKSVKVKKVKQPKVKKPKVEKKKKVKKPKGGERKIWGIPLDEVEIEDDEDVPSVYAALISVLENYACETKGLFRVTASLVAVDELIVRYEAGEEIDWNEIEDKHLIGGVLMQFLLRLPEPLITFDAYEKLINIATSDCTRIEQLIQFKRIIVCLPDLNRNLLEILMDFLDTLTRDADDNMMTSANLAICFAPGLMRRKEENLQQLMKESPFVNDIVASIIDQYGYFFREEEMEEEEEAQDSQPQAMDIRAFATVTLTAIDISLERISALEKSLEWDRLWDQDSITLLHVFHNLLEKCYTREIKKATPDIIEAALSKEKAASSITMDIAAECRYFQSKVHVHFVTMSDKQTAVTERMDSRRVVLTNCMLARNLKTLLDWLEPLIETKNTDNAAPLDRKVASQLVTTILKQMNTIKQELDVCKDQEQAVLISRVVRGVQKALKGKINSPLAEIDFFNIPPGKGNQAKIEMLQDALEYSFPVCTKLLKNLQKEIENLETVDSDANLGVDLLSKVNQALDKYFDPTLRTEAKPSHTHKRSISIETTSKFSRTAPSGGRKQKMMTGQARARHSASLANK